MAVTNPPAAAVEGLCPAELGAWRGLLRVHASVLKELDAELDAAHGLPLTSYEVLIHLGRRAGPRMRMCDLADSVLLSRSGMSRLVDRLERDGLLCASRLLERRARRIRLHHRGGASSCSSRPARRTSPASAGASSLSSARRSCGCSGRTGTAGPAAAARLSLA